MDVTAPDKKDYEQLNDSLDRLDKTLKNQSSVRFIFVRGIIYGVGFFIGTSILAGIALALLSQLFPFTTGLIESAPF